MGAYYTEHMYRPERIIRSIIPDLRDNIPTSEAPASATQESGPFTNTLRLSERLFPTDIRQGLIEKTELLADGRYRARLKAGNKEKGTTHIHDYILDKTGPERRFSFVDAEHLMGGSKNPGLLPRVADFRPRVVNLLSVTLSDDPSTVNMTALRFRTEALSENRRLFKAENLLSELESMVASNDLPAILAGHENEVVYYLHLQNGMAKVQARYASEPELKAYLRGETDSEMLRGRVTTQKAIIKKFLRYLGEDKFKPIKESSLEGQDRVSD